MNELMTFVFGIIGLGLMILFARKGAIPRYRLLMIAYFCFLASNVFTVAEDFLLPDVFNLLEHIAYLATGFFFLMAAIKYMRQGALWNR